MWVRTEEGGGSECRPVMGRIGTEAMSRHYSARKRADFRQFLLHENNCNASTEDRAEERQRGALKADEDPDRLSFLHAVRVIRRKLPAFGAIPPQQKTTFHEAVLDEILEERMVSSRHRWNPRGIKRKMSNYPLRSAKGKKHLKPIADYVQILK